MTPILPNTASPFILLLLACHENDQFSKPSFVTMCSINVITIAFFIYILFRTTLLTHVICPYYFHSVYLWNYISVASSFFFQPSNIHFHFSSRATFTFQTANFHFHFSYILILYSVFVINTLCKTWNFKIESKRN